MTRYEFNAGAALQGTGTAIGLAVADDSLRRRLKRLFAYEGWHSASAESIRRPSGWDVLVVDSDRLAEVQHPIPVLVLTSESVAPRVEDCAADVRAIMDHEDLDSSFLAAIREITAGNGWVSPTLVRTLLRNSSAHPLRAMGAVERMDPFQHVELTSRESEVAALVTQGMNNSEIAADLYVAESTVKFHMSNILRKTGLRDRSQLAARSASPWGIDT